MNVTRERLAAGTGQNVAAALALRGRDVYEVAPRLNISPKTLQRVIRGIREPRIREIELLAGELDVPEWFLLRGIDGAPDNERLREIEARLAQIEKSLAPNRRD